MNLITHIHIYKYIFDASLIEVKSHYTMLTRGSVTRATKEDFIIDSGRFLNIKNLPCPCQ